MSNLLSPVERHVIEHALGWAYTRKRTDPPYRNHYVAGPDHEKYSTIQSLVARGLMFQSRTASELSGGDPVWSVTDKGITLVAELLICCPFCLRKHSTSLENWTSEELELHRRMEAHSKKLPCGYTTQPGRWCAQPVGHAGEHDAAGPFDSKPVSQKDET